MVGRMYVTQKEVNSPQIGGIRGIFTSKSSSDETSNRIPHRLLVCLTKYGTNICSHRYPSMTNYLGVPIINCLLCEEQQNQASEKKLVT